MTLHIRYVALAAILGGHVSSRGSPVKRAETPDWTWTGELPNEVLSAYLHTALEEHLHQLAQQGNTKPWGAFRGGNCAFATTAFGSLAVPMPDGNMTVEFNELRPGKEAYVTTRTTCVIERWEGGVPLLKSGNSDETTTWDKLFSTPHYDPTTPHFSRLRALKGDQEHRFHGVWFPIKAPKDTDGTHPERVHISIDALSDRERGQFKNAGDMRQGKRYYDFEGPITDDLRNLPEKSSSAEIFNFVHQRFAEYTSKISRKWKSQKGQTKRKWTPDHLTLVLTGVVEQGEGGGPSWGLQNWMYIPKSTKDHAHNVLNYAPVNIWAGKPRKTFVTTEGTVMSPFRFQKLSMEMVRFTHPGRKRSIFAGVLV